MDVLNENGKHIERDITLPSGEVITVKAGEGQYINKTGSIVNIANNRIVKGPPKGGAMAITPENARDYHEMRYREGEEAILAAISGAGGSLNPGDYRRGWQAIGENLVAIALTERREAVEAAKFLGNAAGLLRDRRSGSNNDPNSVTLTVGSEVAARLAQIMADSRSKPD